MFPYYLSKTEFMSEEVTKDEEGWLYGDIWWDPFQFLFSGQPGFYTGSFSPQEEVLACKRTNETISLYSIP
jgi:hypothetical protein